MGLLDDILNDHKVEQIQKKRAEDQHVEALKAEHQRVQVDQEQLDDIEVAILSGGSTPQEPRSFYYTHGSSVLALVLFVLALALFVLALALFVLAAVLFVLALALFALALALFVLALVLFVLAAVLFALALVLFVLAVLLSGSEGSLYPPRHDGCSELPIALHAMGSQCR